MSVGTRLLLQHAILPAVIGAVGGLTTQRLPIRLRRGLDRVLLVMLVLMFASLLVTSGSPWRGALWILGFGIAYLSLILVRSLGILEKR
jgi:hypothetical protein